MVHEAVDPCRLGMEQRLRPLLIPAHQVVHDLVCGKRQARGCGDRRSRICRDEWRSADQRSQGDQGAKDSPDLHVGPFTV